MTVSERQAALATGFRLLDRSYVAWATVATAYAIAFLQRVSPQSVSLSFMADFHTDAGGVAMLAAQNDAQRIMPRAMGAMPNIVRQKDADQQEPAFGHHVPSFHACRERLAFTDESVGMKR